MRYRVVVPQQGRIFIQYRSTLPWWSRLRRWKCTGSDIEPFELGFDSVEEAWAWVGQLT